MRPGANSSTVAAWQILLSLLVQGTKCLHDNLEECKPLLLTSSWSTLHFPLWTFPFYAAAPATLVLHSGFVTTGAKLECKLRTFPGWRFSLLSSNTSKLQQIENTITHLRGWTRLTWNVEEGPIPLPLCWCVKLSATIHAFFHNIWKRISSCLLCANSLITL